MRNHFASFAILAIGFFFTACQKDTPLQDAVDNIVTAEDLVIASNMIQDTEDQIDELVETRGVDDCATVVVVPDDGTFPRTITIDYGNDGCEGPNGRVRKGQLVIQQSDMMIRADAVQTVTPVNFFVDDVQIEGSKTWTNLGVDANDNLAINRVADVTLNFPNGKTSNWKSDFTMTQTEGGKTPKFADNVYEITGSADGVNRNGTPYSVNITEPLVKEKACAWVVSGVTELTLNDRLHSIDYGDGDCDRKATVTSPNGETRDILIHRWW